MNKEEMTKYAFTCMVKDNPDEAVKSLILYYNEIELLKNNIYKAIEYLKENAIYEINIGQFCRDLDYNKCLELLHILVGE